MNAYENLERIENLMSKVSLEFFGCEMMKKVEDELILFYLQPSDLEKIAGEFRKLLWEYLRGFNPSLKFPISKNGGPQNVLFVYTLPCLGTGCIEIDEMRLQSVGETFQLSHEAENKVYVDYELGFLFSPREESKFYYEGYPFSEYPKFVFSKSSPPSMFAKNAEYSAELLDVVTLMLRNLDADLKHLDFSTRYLMNPNQMYPHKKELISQFHIYKPYPLDLDPDDKLFVVPYLSFGLHKGV